MNVNFAVGETIEIKKCCSRPTTGHYCVDGIAVVSFPDRDVVEGRMNTSYYGSELILE